VSRTRITEAHAERLMDKRVQFRLSRDRAYNNAANAEDQKQREEEIEQEVWVEIERDYEIS
jgi:hypothetical protein